MPVPSELRPALADPDRQERLGEDGLLDRLLNQVRQYPGEETQRVADCLRQLTNYCRGQMKSAPRRADGKTPMEHTLIAANWAALLGLSYEVIAIIIADDVPEDGSNAQAEEEEEQIQIQSLIQNDIREIAGLRVARGIEILTDVRGQRTKLLERLETRAKMLDVLVGEEDEGKILETLPAKFLERLENVLNLEPKFRQDAEGAISQAEETLYVLAPLADDLGATRMANHLALPCIAFLYPNCYNLLTETLKQYHLDQSYRYVSEFIGTILQRTAIPLPKDPLFPPLKNFLTLWLQINADLKEIEPEEPDKVPIKKMREIITRYVIATPLEFNLVYTDRGQAATDAVGLAERLKELFPNSRMDIEDITADQPLTLWITRMDEPPLKLNFYSENQFLVEEASIFDLFTVNREIPEIQLAAAQQKIATVRENLSRIKSQTRESARFVPEAGAMLRRERMLVLLDQDGKLIPTFVPRNCTALECALHLLGEAATYVRFIIGGYTQEYNFRLVEGITVSFPLSPTPTVLPSWLDGIKSGFRCSDGSDAKRLVSDKLQTTNA